jgi:hypothetical protein
MIPLIASGAAYLASDVIDAWKTHAESAAASKAVNSADFQEALKAAATKISAAAQVQKQRALPGDLKAATEEILQSPDIQSMAHSNPSATINLDFNSKGELFAPQPNGGVLEIMVGPDLRQQLQQLNVTMLTPGAGTGTAHLNAEINSIHLPVQVNLSAV